MIYDGINNKSCSKVLGQVSSSTKMKKTSSIDDQMEVEDSNQSSKLLLGRKESIRLKIQAKGPICKSRRKNVGSLELVSKDKDQEQEEEENSSWLSNNGGNSSISSPSYCYSDDQIFRNLLKFSLDDWLVSLFISSSPNLFTPRFSNSTTTTTTTTILFDGSKVNNQLENIQDEHEQDITTWLMNSVEIEDKIKSSKWDTQKMGLIDLDGENSEWISDSDTDFFKVNLPIDFPSPSFNNNWSFESQSFIITTITPTPLAKYPAEEEKETEYQQNELTELGAADHEPIFWPCDTKFDWDSEFSWDFLVVSPRKNIGKSGNTKGKKLQERIKMALRRAKRDFEKEEQKCVFQNKLLEPCRRSWA